MSIRNFLSRLSFGDVHDGIEVDGWDVFTWVAIGRGAGMFPVLYMHIQLENDTTGKVLRCNDIQSEAQLTREIAYLMERI